MKGVGAVSLEQGTVPLNHINVQRYVKGKTVWNTIDFTLFDPITPLMICNCLRSVDVDTINFITLNRFSNIAKIGN